jgi:uncharacterized membrane protein YhiD involved in acid resistance
MFESILNQGQGTLNVSTALICMASSIVLGLIIAFVHMKTSKYSKNFLITLSVLPVMVQVVIMMVNGNLGTSVAILGAFSLVRFRSMPGNSREIASIFFAMGIGLAVGMGHIAFAATITLIVSIMLFVLSKSKFGEQKESLKKLKITIPENLEYENVFNDIFEKYLKTVSLEKVKTTNMGSLFELTYEISIKEKNLEKNFIDELRCRNGNLNITLLNTALNENEL